MSLEIEELRRKHHFRDLTKMIINIVTNLLKVNNGRGDNREYEVGRRGRSWERVDDRIEEETTSYKFKM